MHAGSSTNYRRKIAEKKARQLKLYDVYCKAAKEQHDADIILITHAHVDHVGGLKVFCNKYNPLVYISEKIYRSFDYPKISTHYYKNNFFLLVVFKITAFDKNLQIIKFANRVLYYPSNLQQDYMLLELNRLMLFFVYLVYYCICL